MIDLQARKAPTSPLAALLTAGVLALPALGAIAAPAPELFTQPAVGVVATADVDPTIHDVLAAEGSAVVVVRAAEGALAEVIAAAEAAGAAVDAELSIINGFAASVDAAAVEALASHPGVIALTANHEAEFHGGGSSAAGDDWFEETIGADALHALGYDGSGVGIAIVDSGVDGTHPTLVGKVGLGFDSSGDNDGVDRHGHGTFLAGLAAGSGATSPGGNADGVAPGAHVIPVKVGTTEGVRLVDLIEGLQWIHFHKDSHDIDVVNMSFGTRSPQSFTIDPLNYAVQRLWSDGIVVVVSAGNLGEQGPSSVTKPGDDPFVITVGSTDSRGTVDASDDTVPAFSGQGPTLADGISKPDIVAPGRSVISAYGPDSAVASMTSLHVGEGWVKASGTSMSAAVVSGAVALLLDANPAWTPDQVKGALLDGAAPGPVGNPNVDGHGVLDVVGALNVTSPTNYNAGIPFGTGTGTLAQTLGLPLTLTVDVKVQECVLLVCTWVDSTIVAPSADLIFWDKAAYLYDWSAATWADTQWQGNQWQGNQWQGNQWQGNQWQGNQWQGNQWQGNQWQGNQWQGNQWQGNQWQGHDW